MLTTNTMINDLIGDKRGINGDTYNIWYKDMGLTLILNSDYCEIKSEFDMVKVLYSYNPEETKLCLDMLCDSEYYEMKSDKFKIRIYCTGIIGVYFGRICICFTTPWYNKMPFIEYITKTKLVLADICNMNPSTKTELIEIYNSMMECSQTKNARN